jgi:hypothetical protein
MDRTPPVKIRRQLAEEVGFGCPVPGCGSPYLTWHHFDPPWAEREQHDQAGMVALCRDHHPEADAGAFSRDQLREFKRVGRDRTEALGAKFNWMRDELLAVVGGNFYLRTPIAVRLGDKPIIWFNRDALGRLLVNLRMPTTADEPRMLMLDNFWITEGSAEVEIVCPPSGRLVSARYPNGDQLKVEFFELDSVADLDSRYPLSDQLAQLPVTARERLGDLTETSPHAKAVDYNGVEFPLAVVEITMDVAGTDLRFGPTTTSVGGVHMTHTWIVGGNVGIQIGAVA